MLAVLRTKSLAETDGIVHVGADLHVVKVNIWSTVQLMAVVDVTKFLVAVIPVFMAAGTQVMVEVIVLDATAFAVFWYNGKTESVPVEAASKSI